jgi:hypothetical protein
VSARRVALSGARATPRSPARSRVGGSGSALALFGVSNSEPVRAMSRTGLAGTVLVVCTRTS